MPWTLTYDPDLRKWSREGQKEPAWQISRTKVISFESYYPETKTDRQTHTHTHTHTLIQRTDRSTCITKMAGNKKLEQRKPGHGYNKTMIWLTCHTLSITTHLATISALQILQSLCITKTAVDTRIVRRLTKLVNFHTHVLIVFTYLL